MITSDPHNAPQTADTPVNPARRKLGLGLGVGALVTLASRPVLAVQCVSPSAHASASHLVSTHGQPSQCTGLTPAQWLATAPGNNPGDDFPGGNTEFNDTFPNGSGINWPDGVNGNLRAVMLAADNGNATPTPNPISKEFAATLLNIRDGRIPAVVLDLAKLMQIWTEYRDLGFYTPRAGVQWFAGDIILYFQSLQGV